MNTIFQGQNLSNYASFPSQAASFFKNSKRFTLCKDAANVASFFIIFFCLLCCCIITIYSGLLTVMVVSGLVPIIFTYKKRKPILF